MSSRAWFYLGAVIIIAGMLVYAAVERAKINQQQILIQDQSTAELKDTLTPYLAKQTDGHKLISLAKHLNGTDPSVLQLIIDRAYALEPKDRDILILDSAFHPELKSQIIALDPLYSAEQK